MKNISFLFGAGISIHAGAPCTDTLTDLVLTGKGVIHTSLSTYMIRRPGQPDPFFEKPYVELCKRLCSVLTQEIKEYYSFREAFEPTYEDIYYIASQLEGHYSGEFDNPVMLAFEKKIEPVVKSALHEFNNVLHYDYDEPNAWREVLGYLQGTVGDTLYVATSGSSPRYGSILSSQNDCDITTKAFITLNHDLLLDDYLRNNDISFFDGFKGDRESGIRYWQPEHFVSGNNMPLLIKVHGSLDWHWLSEDPSSKTYIASAKPGTDVDHSRGPNGSPQHSYPWMSRLLMGTHNKLLEYTFNPSRELVLGMSRTLAQTDSVIVAGYGFHDKGINSQLILWLYAQKSRKLVIVNPCFDALRKQANPAFRRLLEMNEQSGQLALIESKFEDVSWDEIRSHI